MKPRFSKERCTSGRVVLGAFVAFLFLFEAESQANQPCITNLAPGQGGVSLSTFKNHSAKLGAEGGPLECAANGKEKEAAALKKYLKGLFVIGMLGYNNEKPPFNYMGSLQRFVDSNGGKFIPMHTHSDATVNADAKYACARFRNMAGKRVVLIGHSKGGATALYMHGVRFKGQFVGCPELMDKFDAVILVNAVIQGTEAADIAVESSSVNRALAKKIMEYELVATMVGSAAGGASLTTKASQARLADLKGKVNRNKVVCVRSTASAQELGDRMFDPKEAAQVFKGKPNDGLVSRDGQYSEEFCGHEISISGAHHKALIERDSAEPSVSNDAREAFAAFLLNKARAMAEGGR